MNTLAALMSKLGTKPTNPEVIALCGLIDAHVANLEAQIAALQTRTDSKVSQAVQDVQHPKSCE